ncbi:ATP-binding protein [Thermodesulfobacteriota bacterium]
MSLKGKNLLFLLGIFLLIMTLFYIFQEYKKTNNRLLSVVVVLNEIQNLTHEVEVEVMKKIHDSKKIKSIIAEIPVLSREYQGLFNSETKPRLLVNLEISFVRISRVMDRSLPGQTLKKPLLEQIHNEIAKIKNTDVDLLRLSHERLNVLRERAEFMSFSLYILLLSCGVGVFIFISKIVIQPILEISSQIDEVREGKRNNITASNRRDEIGRLHEFTRRTIDTLQTQSRELAISREEMHGHYQRQVAFAKILELSATMGTLKEFLQGLLQIILTLDWLKVESKGGIFLVEKEEMNDAACLVLGASLNFSPEILGKCARVPFGTCICGRVASTRVALHVDCIDDRHEVSYQDMLPHGHYCLPISFGEELLGVLTLYLDHGKKLKPEEISFLEGVSNILAESIIRKRLEDRQILIAAAVDQAGEGVVITDRKGTIQYVNPFMTSMSGYSIEELVGNKLGILKSGKHDREFYKELWETIVSGRAWEGTISNRKKDGSLYEEKMVIAPVLNHAQEITNFVAIKKDITREKNLEAQLLQAQKMEAVGTLAGGVAHDFNNILTSIIGYSEIVLMQLADDDPLKERVKTIYQAGEQAAALTRQLLAFSRKQPLAVIPVNLNEIVTNLSKMLERLIGEDIILQIQTRAEIPSVIADPVQIEQVLMNLVVNARDAMPCGGCLTIETDVVTLDQQFTDHHEGLAPGNFAMLTVTDTGEGISQEVLEHIFEPFYTTKEVGRGTGLGLATLYGIIKQHDGHIEIDSMEGKGSTFRIYLPLSTEEKEEESSYEDEELSIMPTGQETILVVDDEFSVRKLIVDTLQPLGYQVIDAACVKEAVELNQTFKGAIDLLITDVVMPGMNGLELCEILEPLRPEMRVIFMTGYSDNVVVRQGNLPEGKILFYKPLAPSRIASLVRGFLDGTMKDLPDAEGSVN